MLTLAQDPFCSKLSGVPKTCVTSLKNGSSDKALIRAIADGDQYAMRLLYARHSGRIYRFALRFIADENLAEDLVNEVFLAVWQQAKGFEGRSQVSTWLLGITRRKALQAARRRSSDSSDGLLEAIEDASDNPEIVLQKKQNSSFLSKCLGNLSAAHREVINLVYYNEKSVDEVADIIQVSRNTVKTRMFYARNHLSKLLAEAAPSNAQRERNRSQRTVSRH